MKIQDLPESTRKIIFWVMVIMLSLGLLAWWAQITQNRISSFKGEELKEELGVPFLQEELEKLPKIEMPKIDEETLKKIEEMLKEAEKTQPAE